MINQIFFSYGHDENRVVVERLAEDLRAHCYKVWIDKERLEDSDPWRRKIFQGIMDSDVVMAFTSKYSVRHSGVCLDELNIAVNVKAAMVQAVLLESEARPPQNISERQYIDMSVWREHYDFETGQFDHWYEEKLQQILKKLAAPETIKYGAEAEKLKGILHPALTGKDYATPEHFFGRDWLREQVRDWAQGNERFLLLTGEPGIGKSAFASSLYFTLENVAAIIFCKAESRLNNADSILRLLIFRLAMTDMEYRERILAALEEYPECLSTTCEMVQVLLSDPLSTMIDGEHRQMIIILDGLDELDAVSEGGSYRNPVADILTGPDMMQIQPYFRFLITSRPKDHIINRFSSSRRLDLNPKDPNNMEDMRCFLREKLKKELLSFEEEEQERLLDDLCAHTEGNFQYAYCFSQEVKTGRRSLQAKSGAWDFPRGLSDLYQRGLDQVFHGVVEEDYESLFEPPLAILTAIDEPVPSQTLAEAAGWRNSKNIRFGKRLEKEFFDRFSGYLIRSEYGIRIFHKSLTDWLQSVGISSRYYILPEEIAEAHRSLTAACSRIAYIDPGSASDFDLLHILSALREKRWWRTPEERLEQRNLLEQTLQNTDYLTEMVNRARGAINEFDYQRASLFADEMDYAINTIFDQRHEAHMHHDGTLYTEIRMLHSIVRAKLFLHQNDLAAAMDAYVYTNPEELKEMPDLSPDILEDYLSGMAFCYYRLSRTGQAEEVYRCLLQIIESTKGKHHVAWLNAGIDLARVYRIDGRYGEAYEIFEEMDEDPSLSFLFMKNPGLRYKRLFHEAWTRKNNNQGDAALSLYIQAEEVYRDAPSDVSPGDRAMLLFVAAGLHVERAELHCARELMGEAIDIFRRIHGSASLEITDFYDRCGEICMKTGWEHRVGHCFDLANTEFMEAEYWFQRAYQIRMSNYGDTNRYMNLSLHHLVEHALVVGGMEEKIRQWLVREERINRYCSYSSETAREKEKQWILREQYNLMVSPLLSTAAAEVGYREKSVLAVAEDEACIYEKENGAGCDNYTKYGKQMHLIQPENMDYPAPWCDAFVDWCFCETYDVDAARALLGDFDDYTPSSARLFQKMGRWVEPTERCMPGDQIFLRNDKRICHTGIVVNVSGNSIYTVEGNVIPADAEPACGGGVEYRCYKWGDPKIAGFGRPDYDAVSN